MTQEKLEQIYYLKKELKIWRRRLRELEADIALSSRPLDGMPFSKTNATGDPTQEKAIKLANAKKEIERQIDTIEITKAEIEKFILSIEDPEMRMILEYRCVYNLAWWKIGKKINLEQSTCRKKYREFLFQQRKDRNKISQKSQRSRDTM